MKLIVISNPTNLKDEHQVLCSFFEAGLECFHLRKPEFSESQMEEYLLSVPEEYHNRVILHSHYSLAGKFHLRGIHYSKNCPVTFKENLAVSLSVHSIKEIEGSGNYDYVFLSPVFDSISKIGYKSKFDLKELKKALQLLKVQDKKPEVIALGGIDEENISIAREIGFDGVAVLGSIWGVFSKTKSISDTIEKFNKIHAQC